MQLLSLEQSLDLVRNRVVRVVTHIGRYFMGSSQKGGAGPTGNIQDFLVRGLLCHLHRINGAHFRDIISFILATSVLNGHILV